MYICICNRYRDAEIRAAAANGARTAADAYRSLGNGPCCGRCVPFAQDLIDRVHAEHPAARPLLAAAE